MLHIYNDLFLTLKLLVAFMGTIFCLYIRISDSIGKMRYHAWDKKKKDVGKQ